MQYYPIDENLARRAKEMNSFFEYEPGSATAEYRRCVDGAARIAEAQKQRVDPIHHPCVHRRPADPLQSAPDQGHHRP